MSSEHLQPAQIEGIALLARGDEPDAAGAEPSVDLQALLHLRTCSLCRARLAEAALDDPGDADSEAGSDLDREATNDPDPLDDLEDFLEDYVVVDLEPGDVERSNLTEMQPRLAASPTRIASIGPARDRARAFRSVDQKLAVDVREDSRDDACYVYLLPDAGLDRQAVRLYVPPGLVRRWPESGYFRYPRYTFDAVDWSAMKLLYPRQRKD